MGAWATLAKKHWAAISANLFILLVCFPSVAFAPSFKTCVRHIPGYEAYQHQPEGLSYFTYSLLGKALCIGPYIETNANAIIALFTVILTISTVAMWLETRRLTRGSEEQGTREMSKLVPYVQISDAQFEWAPGKVRIIVTIQNSGQMPAKWFEVRYGTASVKKGDKWAIPSDLKADSWANLGGPGVLDAALYDDRFTANAITNTNADEERNFFFLGKVRYADLWDNEYETEFAFFTPNAKPTIPQNGGSIRKMSRPTGKLASFVLVKKAD